MRWRRSDAPHLEQVPHDHLAMAPRILDEEPVGIVAAGNHPRQVTSGHRRRHRRLVMSRHPRGSIHRYAEAMQHAGIGVVAGHGKNGIGGNHLHRGGFV